MKPSPNLEAMSHRSSPVPSDRTLQRLRRITHLLDNSIQIPGIGYRIGLDPIMGLLPGGGDLAGTVLSAYIVLEAARFGLPKSTVVRMVVNLLLDATLGSLPVVGDFFDATWKANSRNLALLEAHAAKPQIQRQVDRGFLILLGVVLVLIVLGVAVGVVMLVNLLVTIIGQ